MVGNLGLNQQYFSNRFLLICTVLVIFLFGCVKSASQNNKPVKKTYINPKIDMTFVFIPPGNIINGKDKLEIDNGFYLQTTEVTQGQWKRIIGSNPSYFRDCGEECPVENVAWPSVQDFITLLNQVDKNVQYRLPTENEWSYACCACDKASNLDAAFIRQLFKTSWFIENSNYQTHKVKTKKPNRYGLYDMLGNVAELCSDASNEAEYHTILGGHWYSYLWGVSCLRGKGRTKLITGSKMVGFRLVAIINE